MLRAQRDRLQTYYEQQKDRADGLACLRSSPGCSRRAARGKRPSDSCRTRNAWVGTCEGRVRRCACRAQTRTRAKCRKRFPRTRRRQRRSPLLHVGRSCRGREEEAFAEHSSGAQHGRLEPQSNCAGSWAGVRRSRTDARRDAVRAHSAGEPGLMQIVHQAKACTPRRTVGPWPTWRTARGRRGRALGPRRRLPRFRQRPLAAAERGRRRGGVSRSCSSKDSCQHSGANVSPARSALCSNQGLRRRESEMEVVDRRTFLRRTAFAAGAMALRWIRSIWSAQRPPPGRLGSSDDSPTCATRRGQALAACRA